MEMDYKHDEIPGTINNQLVSKLTCMGFIKSI
jgi:hypothetical protein